MLNIVCMFYVFVCIDLMMVYKRIGIFVRYTEELKLEIKINKGTNYGTYRK